jgi:hypothetical protein
VSEKVFLLLLHRNTPALVFLQVKGIVGKGGLGEDTYLLLTDG